MTKETESEEWKGREGLLGGNTDPHTPVGHKLSVSLLPSAPLHLQLTIQQPPLVARFVRVCPRAWFEHVSLRLELYGTRLEPLPHKVEEVKEEEKVEAKDMEVEEQDKE